MSIKQISVFVENKPGSMSAMTSVLAENEIDMRALSLAETGDFGIVRIIVKDLYKATTVLKDAGYIHSLTDVLGVKIEHTRERILHLTNVSTCFGLLHLYK